MCTEVQTWGRCFCLDLGEKYLCFLVSKWDRAWLEQTMQQLVRRAHDESGVSAT